MEETEEKFKKFYLHESEVYKSLFDHAKSFLTLPGGGIAVNMALLAAIAKEFSSVMSFQSSYNYLLVILLIILSASSIILFFISIRLCLDGQSHLIELIRESINAANLCPNAYGALWEGEIPIVETNQKKDCDEIRDKYPFGFRKSLDDIRTSVKSGKTNFYHGAILLVFAAVLFFGTLIISNLNKNSDSEKMTVTIKKLTIKNGNTEEFEIENVSTDFPITNDEIEKIKTLINNQSTKP